MLKLFNRKELKNLGGYTTHLIGAYGGVFGSIMSFHLDRSCKFDSFKF